MRETTTITITITDDDPMFSELSPYVVSEKKGNCEAVREREGLCVSETSCLSDILEE